MIETPAQLVLKRRGKVIEENMRQVFCDGLIVVSSDDPNLQMCSAWGEWVQWLTRWMANNPLALLEVTRACGKAAEMQLLAQAGEGEDDGPT